MQSNSLSICAATHSIESRKTASRILLNYEMVIAAQE
jgi:hypothetical protein